MIGNIGGGGALPALNNLPPPTVNLPPLPPKIDLPPVYVPPAAVTDAVNNVVNNGPTKLRVNIKAPGQ